MSIESVPRLPDPPDLLRRFVGTPLELTVTLSGKTVRVQTNHPAFLAVLAKFAVAAPTRGCDLLWTMVSDPELPTIFGEPTLMESWPVVLLSFGRACFIAFHRDPMELMGFISSGIEERIIEETIIPKIEKLLRSLVRATHA
jgi:hypothetical protein